ncbi:hypothetical protein ACHAWF_013887 [Thalassiosira exigua]
MLSYLEHTRPDCTFAIHQCARYMFEPKQTHEAAVKCIIGCYLKGTMNKWWILDPATTCRSADQLQSQCILYWVVGQ